MFGTKGGSPLSRSNVSVVDDEQHSDNDEQMARVQQRSQAAAAYPLRGSSSLQHKQQKLVNLTSSPIIHHTRSFFTRHPLEPLTRNLLPNLRPRRRRPLLHSDEDDDESIPSLRGSKRKRGGAGSGIENQAGRATRNLRRKYSETTTSSDAMAVDVDEQGRWLNSDGEEEDEANEDESSDEHLISAASPRQLLRLRKDDLVRLYYAAALTADDPELLTKPEIVQALVAARVENDQDRLAFPPSSPPAHSSSDPSEPDTTTERNHRQQEQTRDHHDDDDDENETVAAMPMALRRRATVNDMPFAGSSTSRRRQVRPKPLASRTMSLGYVRRGALTSTGHEFSRTLGHHRTASSSPCHAFPSPPATRLRTRTVSAENNARPNGSTPEPLPLTRQGSLRKRVDFIDKTAALLPSISTPSPRRLRSKDRVTPASTSLTINTNFGARKPARSLRSAPVARLPESAEEDEEERLREGSEEDELISEQLEEEFRIPTGFSSSEEEESTVEEEEEEDQLVTPPPKGKMPLARRTPVRKRLRPRRQHVQVPTPPEDGDDEGSEGEMPVEEIGEEDTAEEEEDEEAVVEDDEVELVVEPKVLRNGKIVGEEVEGEEESIGEEDTLTEEEESSLSALSDEEEGAGSSVADDASIDIEQASESDADMEDAEGGEESDESMEDVDLAVATTKSLVRLRRDDLVRLCETRCIAPTGTKPQLAEALLQWRDAHQGDFSSPSSTSTIHASMSRSTPLTARPNGLRKRHTHPRPPMSDDETPILLRSHHMHMDEPLTPTSGPGAPSPEPELELDLESLGLEDREIPPERLTKLEKIGSGGFKDVYIGKLAPPTNRRGGRAQKVAVAEFRGTLGAMDIKELKLLGGFDHPNIVRFLGVSVPENTRDTPVMIVSELCSNGDLFDYIRNVPPPSLHKIISIMLDIARGLAYLHARKPSVIHRDCKSSNILITAKGTAKIADFGLAKVKQSTRSMVVSLVGTVNWQAPELWHAHPKYNHKVDVWAAAMVFWEMLQWHVPAKKFPWEGMNEHAIYEVVGAKHQRPPIAGLKKLYCPEIVELMERMWQQEHQDRPTMDQVVEELEGLVEQYP